LGQSELKRRPAETVQAMGYFWVGTSKLDDWTSFATGHLGLQPVDRGGAMRAFRMDHRKQRLIADGGLPDGERFFGWEVADLRPSRRWQRAWKMPASLCVGKSRPLPTNVVPQR
jgi:hypothetical protein